MIYLTILLVTITNAPAANVAKPAPSVTKVCTVKRGDTLSAISVKTNVPVQRLAQLNKIANANLIYIGQSIKLA